MPHVKDIIYYYIAFVNRFFTKNVIFLWGLYQCGRAWKPAPTSDRKPKEILHFVQNDKFILASPVSEEVAHEV